jgi:FkbM family methyltransferase
MKNIQRFLRYFKIEARALIFRLLFRSYSQAQEDLNVARLLGRKSQGFYIDIGAANGKRFSNTHYFYNKGWRGINIEPDRANFAELTVNRPHDTNLNLALGARPGQTTLYRFSPALLSTTSPETFEEFKARRYRSIGEDSVPMKTMAQILDQYALSQPIDFISIDTEGSDLAILRSNDWTKYKPQLICVELEERHRKADSPEAEMHQYLSDRGYELKLDNGINRIYQT